MSIGATQVVAAPNDPAEGMSSAEAAAYQAALSRCDAVAHSSLRFLSTDSDAALQNEWTNVVDSVIASGPVSSVNSQAVQCAARTRFPADSLQDEVAKIDAEVTPFNLKQNVRGARVTEIAGVQVLIRCFRREIMLTQSLLAARRMTFLSANAETIDQMESALNRSVARLRETATTGAQ